LHGLDAQAHQVVEGFHQVNGGWFAFANRAGGNFELVGELMPEGLDVEQGTLAFSIQHVGEHVTFAERFRLPQCQLLLSFLVQR